MSKYHHTIYTHWIGLDEMLKYYGALDREMIKDICKKLDGVWELDFQ